MNRSGGRSNDSHPTKIAGLYDLEETLGRGHFAVVKLARHVFTGEKVAVKVIDKTKLDPVSQDHLYQEVRCMKLVQHPNVVRLYEVIDTNSKLYLILELGDGGDLYDYIMKHDSGLSEEFAREYFAQIVRAISFCHKLHVVHRDLKPENVVFFERLGVVKLTDFGFSNRFNPGQKLETSCGSLAYSAPEILLGDSYDAPAVDVWSLGVILYMLVAGQAPFQEANDSETLTMIMDVKYKVPEHVTDECKRLIGRMLVREPEKRATLEEIASDPWLAPALNDDSVSAVPLVSRETVSEEDHTFIVNKMVNGKIASKEEILEALDKDEYNHITATYYLLAERKLRMSRQPKKPLNTPLVNVERCQDLEQSTSSTRVNQALLTMSRNPGDVAQRSRKCSIVTEEEDDDDGEQSGSSHDRRGSRSEGKLNLAVQELRREAIVLTESSTAPTPLQLKSTVCHTTNVINKTLPSSLSMQSPQLGLDGICEEGATSSNSSVSRGSSSFIQKRNTFRKTRTASVSSSDASDEDETRSRRGSTKSLHRSSRDSHDPGGGSGGSNLPGDSGSQNNDSTNRGNQYSSNNSSNNENDGNSSQNYNEGGDSGKRHGISNNSRHKRRTGETRLRESQSLNRITEVQECDTNLQIMTPNSPKSTCLQCKHVSIEPNNNETHKCQLIEESKENNNNEDSIVAKEKVSIVEPNRTLLDPSIISNNNITTSSSNFTNVYSMNNKYKYIHGSQSNNSICRVDSSESVQKYNGAGGVINSRKLNTTTKIKQNHIKSTKTNGDVKQNGGSGVKQNGGNSGVCSVDGKGGRGGGDIQSNDNNLVLNKNKKPNRNTLISRYLYLQKKLVLPIFGSSKKQSSNSNNDNGRLYKAKSCSEVEKTSCTLMRHKCSSTQVKDNLECAAIAVTASIVNIGPMTSKKWNNIC